MRTGNKQASHSRTSPYPYKIDGSVPTEREEAVGVRILVPLCVLCAETLNTCTSFSLLLCPLIFQTGFSSQSSGLARRAQKSVF